MMWPNYSLWLNYSHMYMLKNLSENPAPLCMATRWARWQFVDRGELQGVTRLSLGCWPPPLFPLQLPPSSPHCCPLNSLLACPCPRSSPPPLPSNPSQLTFSPSLTVTENGAAYILDYRWAPDASVKVWIMVDGVLVTFADKEVFFFFQQNFSIAL